MIYIPEELGKVWVFFPLGCPEGRAQGTSLEGRKPILSFPLLEDIYHTETIVCILAKVRPVHVVVHNYTSLLLDQGSIFCSN